MAGLKLRATWVQKKVWSRSVAGFSCGREGGRLQRGEEGCSGSTLPQLLSQRTTAGPARISRLRVWRHMWADAHETSLVPDVTSPAMNEAEQRLEPVGLLCEECGAS
jgi:hypothetical protein